MQIARLARLRSAILEEAAPFLVLAAPLLAAFSFPSMAGAVIVAGFLFVNVRILAQAKPQAMRRWLIAFAALAAWMAVASFWSPAPGAALLTWLRVMALCGFGFAVFVAADDVSALARRRAALTGAGGLFVCAMVLLTEPYSGASLFRLVAGFHDVSGGIAQKANGEAALVTSLVAKSGAGAVFLAPLAIPAALWLGARVHRGVAIVFFVAAVSAVAVHPALAGKLSLVMSAGAFLIVMALRAAGARVIAGVLAGLVVLFPVVAPGTLASLRASPVYDALDPASQQRVAVYAYVAEKAHERPLAGFGFNAARDLSEAAPRIEIGPISNASLLPSHPHNLALQAWLELGLIGAALIAVLIWRLGGALTAGAPTRAQMAARFAVVAGLFSFAFVSYGAWRYEWIGAIFLVAFMARIFERDLQSD